MLVAWFAQTPAKQSAWSSVRTERPVAPDPPPLCGQRAEEVLDVVAVLVGEDVALRERATLRPEACAQLAEEVEVEVDELRRAGSRTGRSTRSRSRSRSIVRAR